MTLENDLLDLGAVYLNEQENGKEFSEEDRARLKKAALELISEWRKRARKK